MRSSSFRWVHLENLFSSNQVGAVKRGKEVKDAMIVFSAAVLVSTGKDPAPQGDHPQFAETPETRQHKNLVVIKWKPKFTQKVSVRSYIVRWKKQRENIFHESANQWGVTQYTTDLHPGTDYTLQVPSLYFFLLPLPSR